MSRRDALSVMGAAGAAGLRVRGSPAAAPQGYDPWIELAPERLRRNAAQVHRRVGGRPILAVVKNNGYGFGHVAAARALDSVNPVSGFAVVKLAEALALRAGGIRKPVLWMGPFDEAALREAVSRDIRPMIYTPVGDMLGRIAKDRGRPVAIEVCVDTGLGRVGVPYRDGRALLDDLLSHSGVQITGVMMTFSEDPDLDREQLRRFKALLDPLRAAGARVGRLHAASSFGLYGEEESFLDQVRPGMALFGVYSELRFRDLGVLDIRPALALRARVAYVKRLEAGESAGYNRAFVAREPTWVATVPMGHVDGVPRTAVKGGLMRIGRQLAPIVAVSASHTIVALGTEATCRPGDLATCFDWEDGSRPEDFAACCGISVYDLLMHLDPTLPRLQPPTREE